MKSDLTALLVSYTLQSGNGRGGHEFEESHGRGHPACAIKVDVEVQCTVHRHFVATTKMEALIQFK